MDAMFEKNMVGLTNGFCLVLYTGERMQQVIWKIQNLGRLDQQKWISPKAMQARARMLIWFSIASFYFNLDRDVPEAHVNAFVSVLQYKTFKLVSENDMDGIKRLLINTGLPSLNEMRLITKGECAGKTFNWLTDVPCFWERFLIELDLLINIGKPKKVKKLSLSYDFKEKMKTQQLNNLLEGAISEVQGSLEDFSKQMKSVILNSFGSLGNYFATLADFDSNIASADITYIKDKLKEFDRKTYWLSWSLEEDLKMVAQTVIKSAKLDKTLGMVHFVGDTIMAVVRGFLNDAGGYVEIRESMKKAEEAATNLAKAETLTGLIRDASRLTDKIVVGFRKNEAFLFLTAKLLKQEKERQVKVMEISELDALRREFLSRYQDYSPAIDSNDVAKLGADFEAILDLLVETLEGMVDTFAYGANKFIYKGNYMEKMKSTVAQLISLMQSRFDYQFDLLDSLAAYVRAQLARSSVEVLRESLEEMRDDLKNDELPTVVSKQGALSTLIMSRLHLLTALNLHCNILEYTNAGEELAACKDAMKTLSDEDITKVITYIPETCVPYTNDGKYVSIPVTKTARQDAVNLQELYGGNSTTFRIPDAQWLVDYGWLPPNDVREKVFYVKGFELFLVSDKDTHRSVQIGVDITPSSNAALVKNGALYEMTSKQEYEFRYKENELPCDKTESNPHQWCQELGDICVVRDGILDNDQGVYPSIFSEWTLQVHDPDWSRIPDIPKFVEVEETLFLQAKVFLCSKTTAKSLNVQVETPPQDTETESGQCGANNYYDRKKRTWKPCPFGSCAMLGGYYCEPSML